MSIVHDSDAHLCIASSAHFAMLTHATACTLLGQHRKAHSQRAQVPIVEFPGCKKSLLFDCDRSLDLRWSQTLQPQLGLYRTSRSVWKFRNFSKSGMSRNQTIKTFKNKKMRRQPVNRGISRALFTLKIRSLPEPNNSSQKRSIGQQREALAKHYTFSHLNRIGCMR